MSEEIVIKTEYRTILVGEKITDDKKSYAKDGLCTAKRGEQKDCKHYGEPKCETCAWFSPLHGYCASVAAFMERKP